ncbi:MAG TPA: SGNH/GDSL hydrolase family protein [Candidatus Corynebacterium avicola]|uniref:SGNH/GDSL hydrolase family protein n=1 Tax=Candidatus Corynebacterium avicola TaxID=2838527 RepID=A0A9D1UMM9_9CORY|nr:SGNH/GDSL hydrolase family protein [Candidatus Corynebacterium avicola]
MNPSPRSLIRGAAATALALSAVTAISPGGASAQDSSSGSSGSSGSSALSGSSGQGSANVPGSATLDPSDPYSEDTTDNLVAFGDSFTANSHSVANNIESSAEDYPQQSGCRVAPDAWPGLLAEDTGTPVQNWACTNSGTSHMLNRVTRAVAAGDVNDSSTVVLSSGMNDKQRGLDDAEITADFVSAVEKIQHAAPDAEIIILGRLATTDPDGRQCSVNLIPYLPLGAVSETTAAYESDVQDIHRTVAERTGTEFIDIRDMTVEHNSTCGLDHERYVAGALDITTPQFNMQSHPSRAGSEYLASTVGEHISS